MTYAVRFALLCCGMYIAHAGLYNVYASKCKANLFSAILFGNSRYCTTMEQLSKMIEFVAFNMLLVLMGHLPKRIPSATAAS